MTADDEYPDPVFRTACLIEGVIYEIDPPIIIKAYPAGGMKLGGYIEGTFSRVEFCGDNIEGYCFRGTPSNGSMEYEFIAPSEMLSSRRVNLIYDPKASSS